MVTVRVSKEPNKTKDFIFPISFLTTRSDFFRRARNDNWKESETRIIEIPQDEPENFAVYINYVYTGQLPTAAKSDQEIEALESGEAIKEIAAEYGMLFRVYVLADKLQDFETKNTIMVTAFAISHLRDETERWTAPSSLTVNIIYNGTLPNSPARRFVTDLWTALDIKNIFEVFHDLNKDFMEDLGDSMKKIQRTDLGNMATKKGIAAYLETSEEK
jgi:hypothetical protein